MLPTDTVQPTTDVVLVTVTEVERGVIFAILQETSGRQPVSYHRTDDMYYDLGTSQDTQIGLIHYRHRYPSGALQIIILANARSGWVGFQQMI